MAAVWEVLGFLRETLLFQSLPLRTPRVEQGALLGMSALCFLLAGGEAEFLILRRKGRRILLPCLWVGALAVLKGLYQLNHFGILITLRGRSRHHLRSVRCTGAVRAAGHPVELAALPGLGQSPGREFELGQPMHPGGHVFQKMERRKRHGPSGIWVFLCSHMSLLFTISPFRRGPNSFMHHFGAGGRGNGDPVFPAPPWGDTTSGVLYSLAL